MRKLILSIFIMMLIVACTAKPGFQISGRLENAEGKTIKLLARNGRSFVTKDSTVIKNGSFKLKGAVEYPDFYFISFNDSEDLKQFFLENSDIVITGNAESIQDLQISGSISNDEYEKYNWLMQPFDERMSDLYQQYQQIYQSGDEAKMEEIYQEYETIQDGIRTISMQFIKDHPESFVSAGILAHLSYDLDTNELDELLNVLADMVKIHPQIAQLENRLVALKNTEIGKPAPDFELTDKDGNSFKLSQKIGAKLLLIDFWAAWCNPCREENPNVVAVYEKYKDKGFDIVGVSLDKSKDDWLEAIEVDNLSWQQTSSLLGWECPVAAQYGVSAIPANFLLDEKGIIMVKDLRGEELEAKIKELLGL